MKHFYQKGVALIMVLVIIALVTIIATQLVTERTLHARRTSNVLLSDNAWQYVLGAETLASIVLIKNLKGEETVNLGQAWATEGIVFPIEGGRLAAEIKDLRSCFNLNGLLTSISGKGDTLPENNNKPIDGEKIFTELLKLLEIDQTVSAEALAARLRDWLDADQQPAGFEGREDYEYSGYAQPYRTGDTLLGGTSELYTISGFSPDLIARILPYVCIIPGVSELVLNINTIATDKPELLSSFYNKLDVNTASTILASRPKDGFDDDEFNTQLPAEAKLHDGAKIEFTSPYFALTTKVELGRARVNMKSLLHYNPLSSDIIVMSRLGLDD